MMDDVIAKFKELRLKNCALNLQEVLAHGIEKNLSALQTIGRLLDIEIGCREKARIALRFKQSRLEEKNTIDQFDFTHHESRSKEKSRILSLVDLNFIHNKKDIIFIGNPGTGKTLLSKCIAYAATQAGLKTLFTTAVDMINQFVAAEQDHTHCSKSSSIINLRIFLCVTKSVIFRWANRGQICSSKSLAPGTKKKSTIITTNLPFAKWGTIFDGTTVATAIADRLVYNSEILILEGRSYRKR